MPSCGLAEILGAMPPCPITTPLAVLTRPDQVLLNSSHGPTGICGYDHSEAATSMYLTAILFVKVYYMKKSVPVSAGTYLDLTDYM